MSFFLPLFHSAFVVTVSIGLWPCWRADLGAGIFDSRYRNAANLGPSIGNVADDDQ